jgi:hypothetical protein
MHLVQEDIGMMLHRGESMFYKAYAGAVRLCITDVNQSSPTAPGAVQGTTVMQGRSSYLQSGAGHSINIGSWLDNDD